MSLIRIDRINKNLKTMFSEQTQRFIDSKNNKEQRTNQLSSIINKIFQTGLLIPILIGCEKEIDMNLKSEGGKPVLYAIIQPDSSVTISLSKSTSILSTSYSDLYQNAKIELSNNNTNRKVLSYPNNTMTQEYPYLQFSEGDSVSINILQDDKIIATSQTVIPERIMISQVDTFRYSNNEESGSTSIQMNIGVEFTDPLSESNYYQLMMIQKVNRKLTNRDTLEIDTLTIPQTDKLIFGSNEGISNISNMNFKGLFTDSYINGKTHRIVIALPLSSFKKETDMVSKEYEFRLYHLTKEYYNYYRAQIISVAYDGLPIFEPIKIPSNVENGFGLVSGITADVWKLEVQ